MSDAKDAPSNDAAAIAAKARSRHSGGQGGMAELASEELQANEAHTTVGEPEPDAQGHLAGPDPK